MRFARKRIIDGTNNVNSAIAADDWVPRADILSRRIISNSLRDGSKAFSNGTGNILIVFAAGATAVIFENLGELEIQEAWIKKNAGKVPPHE